MTNNILEKKYIILDRKNYIFALNLLSRCGYKNCNYILNAFKYDKYGNRDRIIISEDWGELVVFGYSYFMTNNLNYKKEFDINILLREYKLKRILK